MARRWQGKDRVGQIRKGFRAWPLPKVAPPVMWGGSPANQRQDLQQVRDTHRAEALARGWAWCWELHQRAFPSVWRVSKPGARAYTGGPRPSAMSQKCGYLTCR